MEEAAGMAAEGSWLAGVHRVRFAVAEFKDCRVMCAAPPIASTPDPWPRFDWPMEVTPRTGKTRPKPRTLRA